MREDDFYMIKENLIKHTAEMAQLHKVSRKTLNFINELIKNSSFDEDNRVPDFGVIFSKEVSQTKTSPKITVEFEKIINELVTLYELKLDTYKGLFNYSKNVDFRNDSYTIFISEHYIINYRTIIYQIVFNAI